MLLFFRVSLTVGDHFNIALRIWVQKTVQNRQSSCAPPLSSKYTITAEFSVNIFSVFSVNKLLVKFFWFSLLVSEVKKWKFACEFHLVDVLKKYLADAFIINGFRALVYMYVLYLHMCIRTTYVCMYGYWILGFYYGFTRWEAVDSVCINTWDVTNFMRKQ